MSNLLYIFMFDRKVDVWYKWYKHGVDDRRLGQKVGKSQENHISSKILVFKVFYFQKRGTFCYPMVVILLQSKIIIPILIYIYS